MPIRAFLQKRRQAAALQSALRAQKLHCRCLVLSPSLSWLLVIVTVFFFFFFFFFQQLAFSLFARLSTENFIRLRLIPELRCAAESAGNNLRSLARYCFARARCQRAQRPSRLLTQTTADLGSLRQALMIAHDGDTINFAVTGTITLTSGGLPVNKSLTISGPGKDQLSIDGNQASLVFGIFPDKTATISGLSNQEWPDWDLERARNVNC